MPAVGPKSPQEIINTIFLNALTVSDQTASAVGALGIPLELPFLIADAATGDIDVTMPEKFEVTDVVCVKRNGAGAGNTMQVKNSATAISDAIACAVDDAVTRAASIVDGAGTNVIAAAGTLRITATRAAGTRNAQVFVRGYIRL